MKPPRSQPRRRSSLRRRTFLFWGSAALSVGALLPLVASAVPVTGRVEVSGDLGPAKSVERQNWEVPNGLLPPEKDHIAVDRELAVVLIGGSAAQPVGCSYELRGGDFTSRTLVAAAGSTIRISNRDGCSHELLADGLDTLNGSELSPGQVVDVGMPASGHFEIRDRLYAHVETHLHAVANLAACGDVSRKGYVRFGDVPAGSYVLKVFRGSEELVSQQVDVPNKREVALSAVEVNVAPSK